MNTAALRTGLGKIILQGNRDLRVLWRQVDSFDTGRTVLMRSLPILFEKYGQATAEFTAAWYDTTRADLGVAGRFRAVRPDLRDPGIDALAAWGLQPLLKPKPDLAAAQTLIEGGMQKRYANVGRELLMESAVEDPNARGWQRAGSGECDFCEMLISRGQVFTRRTADFGAHDHCKCTAVPAFSGQPIPVRPYAPTPRAVSDADRDRARAWIAENL